MGRHSPPPRRSPRPGSGAGQAWVGMLSLPSPPGPISPLAKSSPALGFLPWSLGAAGPRGSRLLGHPARSCPCPCPCPSPLPWHWRRPARVSGNRSGPGPCNPIPGRGNKGTGQRRRPPAGWVSEGAAGNERGKSRCRRFPRAGRAGRPPSARPAAAASSHAARRGAKRGGIWVTGPSPALRTLRWPPQRALAGNHVGPPLDRPA